MTVNVVTNLKPEAGRERSGGVTGVSLELSRRAAPERAWRSVAHTCRRLYQQRQLNGVQAASGG